MQLLVNVDDMNQLEKLEFVDNITKLGLANLFDNEIRLILDNVVLASSRNSNIISREEDGMYATALHFRLLTQYGYEVSDGLFFGYMDANHDIFNEEKCGDLKGIVELFEASELNSGSENVLDKAKSLATETLQQVLHFGDINDNVDTKKVDHVLALSSHKRVNWFDVKWHMKLYEEDKKVNLTLLRLAKLNFNIAQASHQDDLKDISRWWKKLGLIENMDFTRDRLVESFMCSLGLASGSHSKSFRKWIAKVVLFILVIDDVYDLYGSLQELQCFTNAVERWDVKEIEQLPKCMQLCFYALYNTTNSMAREIQTLNGWDEISPLPYLINANDHEDIKNTRDLENFLQKVHHCVYNSSLIIRLCNDLATAQAEQERGDAPSSILCCMKEYNVSEKIARKYIEDIIENAWKQVNGVECSDPSMRAFVDIAKNAARVAHNLYQYGDGFGVQDQEIKRQIKSLLVEPSILG
ncbi:hypothetical protein ACFE04_001436 [Oxalis oulophora]